MTLASLFPAATFSTVPATDLGWHPCSAFAGDDHRASVRISYRRWGYWNELLACGLCESSELTELFFGNPLPEDVRVEHIADHEMGAAA